MGANQRPRPRGAPPGGHWRVDRKGPRPLPVLGLGYARDRAALGLGIAIERERERYDISAAHLADHLDVSVHTLYAWERGQKSPPLGQILRVAWALGIEVTALLDEVQ